MPYTTFTGGVRIFAVPELNSPPDGEPRIYENMDYGRYRVVATGVNGCTTTITLEDSVYMLPPPSIHKLSALHGDTVNCNIRLADGTIYTEFTELQVDRFMEGATYTLYKNGVPDPDKEPDRTSPIGWSHIGEGEYEVHVETREGCTGTTNRVRIRNVDAPREQTLSASGSLCAELDTDGDTKTLTIDATEPGITYEVYRQDPANCGINLSVTVIRKISLFRTSERLFMPRQSIRRVCAVLLFQGYYCKSQQFPGVYQSGGYLSGR